MAGTNSGDLAIFAVDAGSVSLTTTLVGGHRGCVRGFEVITTMKSSLIITGGEDARLCQWDLSSSSSSPSTATQPYSIGEGDRVVNSYRPSLTESTTRQGGGPARRQKKKMPHDPY